MKVSYIAIFIALLCIFAGTSAVDSTKYYTVTLEFGDHIWTDIPDLISNLRLLFDPSKTPGACDKEIVFYWWNEANTTGTELTLGTRESAHEYCTWTKFTTEFDSLFGKDKDGKSYLQYISGSAERLTQHDYDDTCFPTQLDDWKCIFQQDGCPLCAIQDACKKDGECATDRCSSDVCKSSAMIVSTVFALAITIIAIIF